jgi:hypothetical protein
VTQLEEAIAAKKTKKNQIKKKSTKQSQRVTELEEVKVNQSKKIGKKVKELWSLRKRLLAKKIKTGAGLVRELGGGDLNTCKQFF